MAERGAFLEAQKREADAAARALAIAELRHETGFWCAPMPSEEAIAQRMLENDRG